MGTLQRFVTAVQDWPVLVQGALGSGLFWLVLLVAQRTTAFLSSHIALQSKHRRQADLKNQLLRFHALKASAGADSAAVAGFASVLLYRTARPVIKALMWLTLGLVFQSVLGVLGVVGFVGCLYYLLTAFNIVRPLVFDGDIDQKIAELEQKLAELDA